MHTVRTHLYFDARINYRSRASFIGNVQLIPKNNV
jgi:hypothetical protein